MDQFTKIQTLIHLMRINYLFIFTLKFANLCFMLQIVSQLRTKKSKQANKHHFAQCANKKIKKKTWNFINIKKERNKMMVNNSINQNYEKLKNIFFVKESKNFKMSFF